MDNIKFENNQFYLGDANAPEGFVKITDEDRGTISIVSTFVNPELRGQGIAEKLTDEVVAYARKNDLKIKPVCSYAVKYFEEREDLHDIVKTVD